MFDVFEPILKALGTIQSPPRCPGELAEVNDGHREVAVDHAGL